MKQGVDISMITAACNARVMFNAKSRVKAQSAIVRPAITHQRGDDFVEAVRRACTPLRYRRLRPRVLLYKSASETYDLAPRLRRHRFDFPSCIIQAEFLTKITEAYGKNPDLDNLLFDDFFLKNQ